MLNSPLEAKELKERRRLTIRGAVQGVGFRPFIFRTARDCGFEGWVRNSSSGVVVEVEGCADSLDSFEERLKAGAPRHAVIETIVSEIISVSGEGRGFSILESDARDDVSSLILPDLAVCADCLREMNDPSDRRYRYPFINCTQCGPRFTIMAAMPYDRAQTSMGAFESCAACVGEYDDPLDRRFHAQPIACPECGPQLELWDRDGSVLAGRDDVLKQTVEALRAGRIVALKGGSVQRAGSPSVTTSVWPSNINVGPGPKRW